MPTGDEYARPVRDRHGRAARFPLLFVPIASVLLVAACGLTGPTATSGLLSSPTPGSPSGSPDSSSTAPSDTPSPTPGLTTPTPQPSQTPLSSPNPAAACSGSAANQNFFTSAAQSMSWDVYCAVLPSGWFVDAGTFRLKDGGSLDVAYKGPNGARFELQEGSFCTSGLSACSPHDRVIGPAAFGDRQGGLDSLGPNLGYAIYVNPGQAPAWQAVGTGLDQATFTGFGAALVKVAP